MRNISPVAALLALTVFAACDAAPTDPMDLAPVVAPAPGGNGKGGGGGGNDGPANSLGLADRVGDGVFSDDGSAYVDGSQRVSVGIDDQGLGMLLETREKGRTIERRLCHDLGSPATIQSASDLQEFETQASAIGPISNLCVDVRLQTKRHAWGGSVLDMAIGETGQAAGTIYLLEVGAPDGPQDSFQWRLQFATDGRMMDEEGRVGEGLCLTRDSATQWTVRVGGAACGGQVDDVLELWRYTSDSQSVTRTLVATYVMPFEFVFILP